VKTVQADRRGLAEQFAKANGVVLVLKGQGTIVSDGKRIYENTTGNPGMATGGAGDVLTGLIAALLGQGLEPFGAAQLGVFIHGRAGDLVAQEIGEAGMIASDLLSCLPRALREHVEQKRL
jgi:ADP-dependent NAD(P)H-hydrate dehydratase